MKRLFLTLAAALLGCLTVPADLHAQDARDYFNRGVVWANKGEYDTAIANFTAALRFHDLRDAGRIALTYANRGVAYYSKGEYDTAIADFNDALPLFHKTNDAAHLADAYYNRGSAWFHKGEYDKAIDDFHAALQIDPEFSNAYYLRGLALEKKSEHDKALADFYSHGKPYRQTPTQAEKNAGGPTQLGLDKPRDNAQQPGTTRISGYNGQTSPNVYGSSIITFDNQSGDPALVRLVGPTRAAVSVPNGSRGSIDRVAAGNHVIYVRYGNPGRYRYTQGDRFDVQGDGQTYSRISITLHTVPSGNYGSRESSEAEFNQAAP